MATAINQDALRSLLAKHATKASKSPQTVTVTLAKAGAGAKTLEVAPGTSIAEAFTQAGFRVKADAASRETLAVYIEEVNSGSSWTDVASNTGVSATNYMSDFSEPVVQQGYYVIATNVKAGF